VSGIRLFQHFGEHSLMKLLSLSDTRELAQGEVLIRRGEILNEMFIVMSGELSIDLGKGPIQATVKKGEVVGEMSLFEGSLPSATLTALTPATVLTFHRDQLFQAMKEDIEFTARLELGLLQAVIRRLRERTETDDDAKNLKNYTVVSILPPETS
jgi:CRP-like cAMP-binding protein